MRAVLGISAWHGDAAAALLVDGEIVAAAQEERFSRKQRDPSFPSAAIAWCLKEADLTPSDIDLVALDHKPLLELERVLDTHLDRQISGWRNFLEDMPDWLRHKLRIRRALKTHLPGYAHRIVYPPQHACHAADAFYTSPHEHAAVLVVDGAGEWATTSLGRGRGTTVELLRELVHPHSLGMVYAAFTEYLGYKPHANEGRVMGLAPFGTPTHLDALLDDILRVRDDGSFAVDMSYFEFRGGGVRTSERFHDAFGGPGRRNGEPHHARHLDIAASIQQAAEEVLLRSARHLHHLTDERALCIGGGVAANSVINGRILRETPFEQVWIPSAPGNPGAARGAAFYTWHRVLEQPRSIPRSHGGLLGPSYGPDEIRRQLDDEGAAYREYPSDEAVDEEIARRLAKGAIVGWFQGRLEYGTRSLGNRSILADPHDDDMHQRINRMVKFRESFRTFSASVLTEDAAEWFEIPPGVSSPQRLLALPLRAAHLLPISTQDQTLEGFGQSLVKRSSLPGITQIDGTTTLQTVDAADNPRFHELLVAFKGRTGRSVLINSSFHVRGEPLVCSPLDAWRCFLATDLDVLVLDRFVLLKGDQTASMDTVSWRAKFAFA